MTCRRRPTSSPGFITSTIALGDRYDRVIKAPCPSWPTASSPIRDAHRAHAQALAARDRRRRAHARPPAGRPRRPGPEQALAALAEAEQTARDEAVDACLGASARLAPLVGAIAAARASHVEVLT